MVCCQTIIKKSLSKKMPVVNINSQAPFIDKMKINW